MAIAKDYPAHPDLTGGGQTGLHSHAGGGGESEITVMATVDSVNAAVAFANVTGLTFEMLASKTYIIEAWLIFQSSATATGVAFALNGPASPVAVVLHAVIPIALTLYASSPTMASRAYDVGTPSVSIDTANANMLAVLHGVVRNGVNAGTLAVRFACEAATSPGVTVKIGSTLRYRQVD